MINEKVDRKMVPLEASEKAAPELNTNLNFRRSPITLTGPSERYSIARNLVE